MNKKPDLKLVDAPLEMMIASDHTCCVSRKKGEDVQIYHIDGDSNNIDYENLCVLCCESHKKMQAKGDNGAQLDKELVVKHRNEWLKEVKDRRNFAGMLVVSKIPGMSLGNNGVVFEDLMEGEERDMKIFSYVNLLPGLKEEMKLKIQPRWDSGRTGDMVKASYDYVAFLESILLTLASFYPQESFNDDSRKFFSEQITFRYKWHWSYVNPGPGSGGSIVNIIVASAMKRELEDMVRDMVMSLTFGDKFNQQDWLDKWKNIDDD